MPALAELVRDADPLVVESAVHALSGIGGKDAIPALAALLKAGDSNLRMTAAQGFGHTKILSSGLPQTHDNATWLTLDAEKPESFRDYSFSAEGGESRQAVNFDLRLGMPAPDAQAIDELQAEAVALTLGSWKELALTNVQADAKKEIDLGEVLPEAKMIITKVSTKNQQTIIEARLEGPAAIHQLESRLKFGGSRQNSSHMHDRQPAKNSGGKTIRQVTIQGYLYEPKPEAGAARQMILVLRYPQDVKRERIRFKLTALDLF